MSKILFLGIPAHGHVNPTLGLVNELIKHGEEIVYYCEEEFKEKIEKAGGEFRSYNPGIKIFGNNNGTDAMGIEEMSKRILSMLNNCEPMIADILEKIKDEHFDCIIYAAMFPYGAILNKILKLPSVSSFAVFATPQEIIPKEYKFVLEKGFLEDSPIMKKYNELSCKLEGKYNIKIGKIQDMIYNKADLNIAYTSKYFVAHKEYYDDSFVFIGPPIYDRNENLDFPFERLQGKNVVYISMGTVFNKDLNVYNIFFNAFKNEDFTVVMSAYNVDISNFNIPENFIVRNYVPQAEVLKYTKVAITHAGMNSTSDLIYNNIPFVAIPIGADQPYMASRSEQLGACIKLERKSLTAENLKEAVKEVYANQSYLENIKKIKESFDEAGGYKKAVEEIFKMKKIGKSEKIS